MEPDYDSIIGLNYSGAKQILRSPSHYQAWLNQPDDDSKAKRLGRLVHLAFLEPAKFESLVVLMPEDAPDKPTQAMLDAYAAGSTKQKPETIARIKWWEEFNAKVTPGSEVISRDEYSLISDITTSAEGALASAKPDTSMWQVESPLHKDIGGCIIKGRPDLVTTINGELAVVDLKTTEDAAPGPFSRDINAYKYHMQGAWYLELTRAKAFYIVAVEKQPPYAGIVYCLSEEAIAAGKALMSEAVDTYKLCLTLNRWPSYPSGIHSISIPKYALPNQQ